MAWALARSTAAPVPVASETLGRSDARSRASPGCPTLRCSSPHPGPPPRTPRASMRPPPQVPVPELEGGGVGWGWGWGGGGGGGVGGVGVGGGVGGSVGGGNAANLERKIPCGRLDKQRFWANKVTRSATASFSHLPRVDSPFDMCVCF